MLHINTIIISRRSCQFLVAFIYMGGVIKHRLQFYMIRNDLVQLCCVMCMLPGGVEYTTLPSNIHINIFLPSKHVHVFYYLGPTNLEQYMMSPLQQSKWMDGFTYIHPFGLLCWLVKIRLIKWAKHSTFLPHYTWVGRNSYSWQAHVLSILNKQWTKPSWGAIVIIFKRIKKFPDISCIKITVPSARGGLHSGRPCTMCQVLWNWLRCVSVPQSAMECVFGIITMLQSEMWENSKFFCKSGKSGAETLVSLNTV
jgi:hypothetical protein